MHLHSINTHPIKLHPSSPFSLSTAVSLLLSPLVNQNSLLSHSSTLNPFQLTTIMTNTQSTSQNTEKTTPKTKPALKTAVQSTENPTTKAEPKPSSSVTETKKRKRDEVEVSDEEVEDNTGEDEAKILELEASKYVPGLFLDLEWCKSVHYDELLEVFDNQGWSKLFGELGIDDVYPKAIQEFCENYGYAKGTITSSVNDVEFSFDGDYLAKLFEVPNEGYDNYFKGKYNLKIGKIGKDEILVELGGKKGVNKIDHNFLSPLGKLLFNVVRRSVFPRTQKRNEASLLDCAVIYCLLFKVQINFPSLMISHLDHTVPSGLKVGYGTLMTKIFKSFNVPLGDYGKVGIKKEQLIHAGTLTNLNLGVLGGSTQWYTEILRMEEENKRMEKEKSSSVRKSKRFVKTDGGAETVDLDEEEVKMKEIEVLVPGKVEQLEQALKELFKKHQDVEGQVFMMRQALSSFVLAFDKKHAEIMACLSAHRDVKGTQAKDAGTSQQKPAEPTADGTQENEAAAGVPEDMEEDLKASVPDETDPDPVPLQTIPPSVPTDISPPA